MDNADKEFIFKSTLQEGDTETLLLILPVIIDQLNYNVVFDMLKKYIASNTTNAVMGILQHIMPNMIVPDDLPADQKLSALLMYCVQHNYLDSIEVLINQGILPEEQNHKNTLLKYALQTQNIYLAQMLIILGADKTTISQDMLVKYGLIEPEFIIEPTTQQCCISLDDIEPNEEYYKCNSAGKHIVSKKLYDDWNQNCPYCKEPIEKYKIYINST